MEIMNFGEFYYPSNSLKKNLEKVIIFTENFKKNDMPNGAVFKYNSTNYVQEILKSDVGCGITAFITQKLNFNNGAETDVLKAVDDLGIHIGQGNHFLDFTTDHPKLRRHDESSSMIYLHSDFNSENVVPRTYSEAKDFENMAKEKRIDYLEKLTKLLGISAKFYNNWTHNSVNQENGQTIYRKGAINLKESDGIGALALNPVDGVMLYCAKFNDYEHSMQHGLGRIGSRGELHNFMIKKNVGIARGYKLRKITSEVRAAISQAYNSVDNYLVNFSHEQSQIGVCVPELVVTTKSNS